MATCAKHSKYAAGCEPCQANNRHYDQRRTAAITAGTWQPRRPIEEVRPHVLMLRRRNMTSAEIAAAGGTHKRVVERITARDKRKAGRWVTGEIAAGLLTIPVPARKVRHSLRYKNCVPAIAGMRRLQGLARVGYQLSRMATEVGSSSRHLSDIRAGVIEWITTGLDAAIKAAYDRLPVAAGDVIDPDPRAISHAIRRGWALPAAWDDDTIANPNAVPRVDARPLTRDEISEIAVAHVIDRELPITELDTTAERIAVVTALLSRGWSHRRIGEWTRWGDNDRDYIHNVSAFCSRHSLTAEHVPERVRMAAFEEENQIRRYAAAA